MAKTYCSGGLYGEDGDFLVWILGADHRDWSAGDHLSDLRRYSSFLSVYSRFCKLQFLYEADVS
ncbi:hypothetical protein EMIT0P201_12007 [Pseudomonas chlororaphis]